MPDFLSYEGHDLHLLLLDDDVVIPEDSLEAQYEDESRS